VGTPQIKQKSKGLFDHIRSLTHKSYDPNYFNNLDESFRKTWSSYMIHRFISMNMEWIDIVNIFQQFSHYLSDEIVYKLYATTLPKNRFFLKYVTGKKEKKFDKSLIEFMSRYYEVSLKEATEYIIIFLMYSDGKQSIISLLNKYGIPKSDIKSMLKGIK